MNRWKILLLIAALSTDHTQGFAPSRPLSSSRKIQSSSRDNTKYGRGASGNLQSERYGENVEPSSIPSVDTSSCCSCEGRILDWVSTLGGVERSEPEWVGSDILTISPSGLIQEHLESLFPPPAPKMFPAEADRALFDFEWRYSLLSMLPQDQLDTVLAIGTSNSHPLRMQLIALPPSCCLDLHVHPAIELNVPLCGSMGDRRALSVTLPERDLRRGPDMEVGGMGGQFTSRPSPEQLDLVREDVSNRTFFEDMEGEGVFEDTPVAKGEVMMNCVGSVHQSYVDKTKQGCLLFALGPNVHAYFRRGQFRQRDGIDSLQNIDHLLD